MTTLLIDLAIAFGAFWLGWFAAALMHIVHEEDHNFNQNHFHRENL